MDETQKHLIAKAKRRIKKFVETGEHQPRVYATDDPQVFEYKVKHYVQSLFFKADVLGRLRLLKH